MENGRPLNRDMIKYLAAAAMLLNHVATVFLEPGTALYRLFEYTGYFTAVTMCYFLVEGYEHTGSKRKYAKRLLLFAVISQPPYMLAFEMGHTGQLNMLFTLFFCFLILYVQCDSMMSRTAKEMTTVFLVFVTVFSDWALFAPVFTLLFLRGRRWGETDRRKTAEAFAAAAGMFALYNFASYYEVGMPAVEALQTALLSGMGIIISGLLILKFYNGQRAARGRTFSKWFFYIFYPAHITILILVRDVVLKIAG